MKILYMKNKKILFYKDILLRHNNNVVAAKKEKVYNNEDIIVRVPAKTSSAQFAIFLATKPYVIIATSLHNQHRTVCISYNSRGYTPKE